jgi:tRNA uracil 4-sulfurtransferase
VTDRALLVTVSGEVHTKSPRTQRSFRRTLGANLRDALAGQPGAVVGHWGRYYLVTGAAPQQTGPAAAGVFGVRRTAEVRRLDAGSLDDLVDQVAALAADRVAGRTFGVRVRRRGRHPWRSADAERAIGSRLENGAAGVDLTTPDVWVRVEVADGTALLVERAWEGPGGLPLGTQGRSLALFSGGFDSPVAAWMAMRRGSPTDFVHFTMDCAQSDHAIAVARDLWRRWGAGSRPVMWLVEFRDVSAALSERVPSRLRQVVLKQLMFDAADHLSARTGHEALVTGEALGQVSSQTLRHLSLIDAACSRLVLRPLVGLDKDEIVDWARRIGTETLSARAKEVCNLADGPVATNASEDAVARARSMVPADHALRAADAARVVSVADWAPGLDPVPVVAAAPDGVPVRDATGDLPPDGPVALRGRRAPHVATRLAATGRAVWVLQPPPAGAPAPSGVS